MLFTEGEPGSPPENEIGREGPGGTGGETRGRREEGRGELGSSFLSLSNSLLTSPPTDIANSGPSLLPPPPPILINFRTRLDEIK